jgi:Bacterial alpha-L-rhamnosidase 6 hairpin glycosidase domain/Bacterial alpha-L-rhamnosidase C-terminal domain
VSIDSISLNFTAFLGTPDTFTGWFECSDATLNQFWYDAAYTNEMCIDTFRVNDTEPRNAASESLVGKLVIHDGPKRDRDPYVGDVALSGITLYLTHDASVAAENVLADLADHQRSDGWVPPASIGEYSLPLFDYPLWWIIASFSLWQYTNADSYMQRYYLTLAKVLDEFYLPLQDETGLLVKGPRGTGNYGDYAFLPRTGIVTYYNALYFLALQAAVETAYIYGHHSDIIRWENRASQVKNAIDSHLWDPSAGAYFDSLTKITHGQDGNAIAAFANIANTTQTISLLNFWSSLALPHGNPFFSNDAIAPGSGFESRVYPFISTFEIAARFQTSGMGDSAIEQMKRMYGWMASQDPGTTFWEGIGEGGSMYEGGYTSAAHGWSTGVIPAMTNYVLGVQPTGKGFSQWSLKPMPVGGVEWAKGVVPTPQGNFMVNWTTMAEKYEFFMDFEIPQRTSGDVAVPVSGESKIVVLDGHVAWDGTPDPYLNTQYADRYITLSFNGDCHWGRHQIGVLR